MLFGFLADAIIRIVGLALTASLLGHFATVITITSDEMRRLRDGGIGTNDNTETLDPIG